MYSLSLKQKELDKIILDKHNLHGEDLYTKKKNALLVELGELANELRFFKFWSTDQEPRIYSPCPTCEGRGFYIVWHYEVECPTCYGDGKDLSHSPALEEYIDCIHFMLSIVNNHPDFKDDEEKLKHFYNNTKPLHYNNLEDHFSILYAEISNNLYSKLDFVFNLILGLGVLIGFSYETVKEAYNKKYDKNIQRQKEGY